MTTTVNSVLVVSETIAHARELVSAARALSDSVEYFCFEDAQGGLGAIRLTVDAQRPFIELIPAIEAYVKDSAPDVILLGSTCNCRLLAAKLAAAFDSPTLVDAQSLELQGSVLRAMRMVYGGAANRVESVAVPTAVAVVVPAAFEPCAVLDEQDAAKVVGEAAFDVVVEGVEAKQIERVNLAAAKSLVCVGRGFAAQEELVLAEGFAGAIGAEIGCTRPISEGEGWMSSARYVGVSGLMLKPDVYFGLGISGQVQHMVGINSARLVVAVNSDRNAPIFKQCDYGLVATVQEALPLLTEAFNG